MRKFLIQQTIHLSPLCYNISYSLVLSADLTICAGLNEHWLTGKNATLSEKDMSTFPGIRNSWIWNTGAWPDFNVHSASIQTSGKVPFDGNRGRISNSRDALHLIQTKGKKKFPAWSAPLMGTFTAPTFCSIPEKLCRKIKGYIC
ncbi:hypothetical protein CXU09_08700 [Akkermansia muciniphila]|uniref:Uncharacterized protein n=1 Tax=Akkermansia muciniphila TaxID=239935 RepID=A0AAP8NLA1_9BACT|nr:hypothetical protein CXU09_08700 [Akkermansia muciniphila]